MILQVTEAGRDKDNNVSVVWEHDLDNVEMFNVVFDNNGSCTNLSVKGDKTSLTTTQINSGKYAVIIKALSNGRWISSGEQTFDIE